jgi:hypothetical protein
MKTTQTWKCCLVVALLVGCGGKSSSPPDTKPAKAAPVHVSTRPERGGLRERIERPNILQELHQLGLFYQQYFTEFNHAPATQDDFRSYIERDAAKMAEGIKEGYYTVVCKVPNIASSTVLAYQTEPDPEGYRYVVSGDMSVNKMDENQFQKALKGN